ncbi:MAG: T9SS type A sorting domain-containing protein [candidate division Zixibacteria bacterium]|nr:T9SS type A sorting domain-containing protein [candidate division Zixibacteria bacterium]
MIHNYITLNFIGLDSAKAILFSFLSFLIFSVLTVSAEPGDTLWTKHYGGGLNEEAYSVCVTSDSGFVILGHTSSYGAGSWDIYLVKTDSSGDTIFTRTYGGEDNDYGRCITQTSDDGYLIAGYTSSYGAGNGDVYLIKTDASGDIVWTRTFGGIFNDRAYSAITTTDGGYAIIGETRSFGNGEKDVYLIRIDTHGDSLWARTYGGENGDYGYYISSTDDDGFIIAGYTTSFSDGDKDIYLIRTDFYGDTLWTRSYGGEDDEEAWSVIPIDDGFVLTGNTTSYGAGNRDVYFIKTDINGDTLWTRIFGGLSSDYGQNIALTSDNGYLIAGYTASFGAGNRDVYLIKVDSTGSEQWSRTYGGTESDFGMSIIPSDHNEYIISGTTESFGVGGSDCYLLKICDEPGRFELVYNPEEFIFEIPYDSSTSKEFAILSHGGNGYLIPRCDSSWISFEPDSLSLLPGDSSVIGVEFRSHGYNYNEVYQTEIYFESDKPGLEDAVISVEMTVVPPRDIAIISIVSPDSSMFTGINYTPSAICTNNGMLSESFDAGFEIVHNSNIIYSSISNVEEISPGETLQVYFDNFTPSDSGSYLLSSFSLLNGDNNTANDTMTSESYCYQRNYLIGTVSGVLSLQNSPYFVNGDIRIPEDSILIIEPGVSLIFNGRFSFTADSNSTLIAVGVNDDPIIFTAENIDSGWFGIDLVSINDSSIISYAVIEYMRKSGESLPGGAISCYSCSPTIRENLFRENEANSGAGIYCADDSNPIIRNNLFDSNISLESGGAISCDESNPLIKSNIFVNNSSLWNGGAIYCTNSYPVISRNLIYNNTAGLDGGGVYCYSSIENSIEITNNTFFGNQANRGGGFASWGVSPIITNTILWNDSASTDNEILIENSEPIITFCDIAGGYEGEGNINVDPVFRNPSSGNYHLMATYCGDPLFSPCIDAGDPEIADTLLDCQWGLGTQRSDMGAYGGGGIFTSVIVHEQLPLTYELNQNFPNPFNSSTTITYSLPDNCNVNLAVYNLYGQVVATLKDAPEGAGIKSVAWDASGYSSGIYFYRISVYGQELTRRMTLLK